MVDQLSKGVIQVVDNSEFSINDALRQITQRIDELAGLNGRALVWDRVQVSNPSSTLDALNQGSADLGTFVTIAGAQTISGAKTHTGTITITAQGFKVTDSSGNIIHSFGTLT